MRLTRSAEAKKICRETIHVYRVFFYRQTVLIGTRRIGPRRGRSVIFSVKTWPYPRFPIYAKLF